MLELAEAPLRKTITAIELKTISKTFGTGSSQTKVLHSISLSLPPGEMVFLTGPSGCGKTTLISIAAGILTADAGSEVTLFGQRLNGMSNNAISKFRQETIGFIFQQFNLVSTLTLEENVAIPLLIGGVNRAVAIKKSQRLLQQVGLGDKTEALPNQLSGGQQQRVAVARALVNDPKLLICDEPTASLDRETGLQVMELLKTIAKSPERCVVIVTHDNRIFNYADRMVCMEDGQVQQVLEGSALQQKL